MAQEQGPRPGGQGMEARGGRVEQTGQIESGTQALLFMARASSGLVATAIRNPDQARQWDIRPGGQTIILPEGNGQDQIKQHLTKQGQQAALRDEPVTYLTASKDSRKPESQTFNQFAKMTSEQAAKEQATRLSAQRGQDPQRGTLEAANPVADQAAQIMARVTNNLVIQAIDNPQDVSQLGIQEDSQLFIIPMDNAEVSQFAMQQGKQAEQQGERVTYLTASRDSSKPGNQAYSQFSKMTSEQANQAAQSTQAARASSQQGGSTGTR